MELDQAQVQQLDLDHPLVADLAVEREALFEKPGRSVVVAALADSLSVDVQRRLAHDGPERRRVPARLDRERARRLVVAVLKRHAREAETRERERLRVAQLSRRLQRLCVPISSTRRESPARRASRPDP